MRNIKQLFKQHPVLEEICQRLAHSEKKTEKQNEQRRQSQGNDPASSQRKRGFEYPVEHAHISHVLKNGKWQATLCFNEPGKERFISNLKSVLAAEPDGIRVKIYRGRSTAGEPLYTKDIIFNEQAATAAENNSYTDLDKRLQQMNQLLEQHHLKPGGDTMDKVEMMRKEFEIKFLEQQHHAELDKQRQEYERKLEKQQDYIAELEDDLDGLEEQLSVQGTRLGEVTKKMERRETPFGEMVWSNIFANAGEAIMKRNPALLREAFQLTDEQLKKIWNSQPRQLPANNNDASSYSEAGNSIDLSGVEDERIQPLQQLIAVLKQITPQQFRKLFVLIESIQDKQSGMLSETDLDKLLQLIMAPQAPPPPAPQSPVPQDTVQHEGKAGSTLSVVPTGETTTVEESVQ